MSAASERATFIGDWDGSKIDKGVEESRKKLFSLNGGFESLKANAGKVDQAFGSLEKVMKQVGATSSATGKAMAEVVGSAGDIAQAFALGGPVLGGIAAATAAVSALTRHWDDLLKKQDEAITKQFAATDDATALSRKVFNDIAGLKEKLADAGLTDAKRAFNSVQREIDAVEQKLALMRVAGKIWTDEEVQAARILEAVIDKLREKQNLAVAAAGLGSGGRGGGGGVLRGGARDGDVVKHFEDTALAAIKRKRVEASGGPQTLAEVIAAQQPNGDGSIFKKALDLEQQYNAQRLEMAKRTAESMRLVEEQRIASMTDAMVQFAAITGEALGAGLAGSKTAFADFLKAASRMAGGFIMLEGGKLAATGVANSLMGNPAGPLQFIGGMLLVGAGAAVQSGGPAAVSAIAGGGFGGGGGGGFGGGGVSRAARDPGVNRAPGTSSSGTGGGFTLIFNFAGAGPAPEQVGNATLDALETTARRSGRTLGGRQGPGIRR